MLGSCENAGKPFPAEVLVPKEGAMMMGHLSRGKEET